jgi:hypothetical protein
MSESPKFEVVDRRRMKAEEEKESHETQAPTPAPEKEAAQKPPVEPGERATGPRLVEKEEKRAEAESAGSPVMPELPQAPTPEESSEQHKAYTASAQRLEDLIRAQNPAAGAPPQMSFDHLVQQLYLTALFQMGAGGAQEGQRPQIDILGARNTIDLLGLLAEKTRGNLSEAEDRNLQTALFDARMGFLELTSMISVRGVGAPPPPPPGRS